MPDAAQDISSNVPKPESSQQRMIWSESHSISARCPPGFFVVSPAESIIARGPADFFVWSPIVDGRCCVEPSNSCHETRAAGILPRNDLFAASSIYGDFCGEANKSCRCCCCFSGFCFSLRFLYFCFLVRRSQ
jgi:hypothetical protein